MCYGQISKRECHLLHNQPLAVIKMDHNHKSTEWPSPGRVTAAPRNRNDTEAGT